MKKQILAFLSLCLCTGCKTTQPVSSTADEYADYAKMVDTASFSENYTVAFSNTYTMSYSDSSMSAYTMDGVLQVGKDASTYTQHIDANGMQSQFSGDYYDGRLYSTFNGVTYYEDMDESHLKQILLVPLTPIKYTEEQIESLSVKETGCTVNLTKEAAKEILLNRYDQYGLDQYDDFEVKSGKVEDTFDENGYFLSETAVFTCTITLSGQTVDVTYDSSVEYSNIGTTEVIISDETKETEKSYVSTDKIDTDAIVTLTDDDDSPEDGVEATFKKRLVNRLNYTKQEDGTYISNFNSDNEQYLIDFDKHVFQYSNRTIHYVYNWLSDQGSMGTCTVDFTNDVTGSECKDTTVETIKDVKNWFQMELYYCGLTLNQLLDETKLK